MWNVIKKVHVLSIERHKHILRLFDDLLRRITCLVHLMENMENNRSRLYKFDKALELGRLIIGILRSLVNVFHKGAFLLVERNISIIVFIFFMTMWVIFIDMLMTHTYTYLEWQVQHRSKIVLPS